MMFKLLFWLGLIGGGVFFGGQVIPVYYNNYKVQNIFDGAAENLSTEMEGEIKRRIEELLKIETVDLQALPADFFDNLSITKEDGKLKIGTKYHIRLWLLDPPESVYSDKDYKESEVKPIDKLRLRAHMDFNFAPHAESP
ncbi:MAG: DUF4845 domain-containing protein [Ghiorsea sp.]|nr:DUF4845 domain-containing protein [Ghiorsea sp.]